MTTLLQKDLKRLVKINGFDYVVTLSPLTLKLSLKGQRRGREFAWGDLVGADTPGAGAGSNSNAQQSPNRSAPDPRSNCDD